MNGQEPGVEPHAPWNMFVIALKHHLKRRRPQEMRDAHNGLNQFQGKGGWHFSFMGGADTIKDKIQAFSHTEYNTEDVIDNISTKVAELKSDVFNRGFIFESKPIEPGLLPDYVYKNLEYYKQIGLIN
jgi:hypothetical protein